MSMIRAFEHLKCFCAFLFSVCLLYFFFINFNLFLYIFLFFVFFFAVTFQGQHLAKNMKQENKRVPFCFLTRAPQTLVTPLRKTGKNAAFFFILLR